MRTDIKFWSYLVQFFLEWEIFEKRVLQKIKTHILCSITPPLPENRAVCEIMWKNTVQRCRPQMTIERMRIACWLTKATYTHSEYVILLTFTWQQWLHERLSVTYIACLLEILSEYMPIEHESEVLRTWPHMVCRVGLWLLTLTAFWTTLTR